MFHPVRSKKQSKQDLLIFPHAFPSLVYKLFLFALNFVWFTGLSLSFGIGQSYYLYFYMILDNLTVPINIPS